MKVFIFGTRGFPMIQGGVEMHCEQLYSKFPEDIEVTVFRRKPYVLPNSPKQIENIKFIDLPSTKLKGFETVYHSFICAVVSVVRRPDVVHVHNIGPGLFSPILKLFGLKVVLTYHSPNYEHDKWGAFARKLLKTSERISLKMADAVIFVNKFQMDRLDDDIKKKSVYIPNGVNISGIEEENESLSKWGLTPNKYILAVGRITPEKGFDLLISAYKQIKTDVKLVIVGAVEYEKDFYEKLKGLASSKKIIFTGYLSGTPLKQLYSHAKLFVLPSYNEGFPLVLLEAMSYQCDILASDIPASHLIELNKCDYFKCGNSTDLTKKIEKKLNQKIRGRKYYLKNYRWESVVRQTVEVYNSVLK